VPPEQEKAFLAAAGQLPETLTCIGEISSGQNVICLDEKGEPVDIKPHSYTHFAEQD